VAADLICKRCIDLARTRVHARAEAFFISCACALCLSTCTKWIGLVRGRCVAARERTKQERKKERNRKEREGTNALQRTRAIQCSDLLEISLVGNVGYEQMQQMQQMQQMYLQMQQMQCRRRLPEILLRERERNRTARPDESKVKY